MPADGQQRAAAGRSAAHGGVDLDRCGDNHFPVDLPRLIDFYMRGLLDLDTIIAERIPLEKINEGFEKMKGGHSARSVVVFD